MAAGWDGGDKDEDVGHPLAPRRKSSVGQIPESRLETRLGMGHIKPLMSPSVVFEQSVIQGFVFLCGLRCIGEEHCRFSAPTHAAITRAQPRAKPSPLQPMPILTLQTKPAVIGRDVPFSLRIHHGWARNHASRGRSAALTAPDGVGATVAIIAVPTAAMWAWLPHHGLHALQLNS